jgi:hypothetical protein
MVATAPLYVALSSYNEITSGYVSVFQYNWPTGSSQNEIFGKKTKITKKSPLRIDGLIMSAPKKRCGFDIIAILTKSDDNIKKITRQ